MSSVAKHRHKNSYLSSETKYSSYGVRPTTSGFSRARVPDTVNLNTQVGWARDCHNRLSPWYSDNVPDTSLVVAPCWPRNRWKEVLKRFYFNRSLYPVQSAEHAPVEVSYWPLLRYCLNQNIPASKLKLLSIIRNKTDSISERCNTSSASIAEDGGTSLSNISAIIR